MSVGVAPDWILAPDVEVRRSRDGWVMPNIIHNERYANVMVDVTTLEAAGDRLHREPFKMASRDVLESDSILTSTARVMCRAALMEGDGVYIHAKGEEAIITRGDAAYVITPGERWRPAKSRSDFDEYGIRELVSTIAG